MDARTRLAEIIRENVHKHPLGCPELAADALIKEFPQLAGWRPIEEAPQDQYVLLYCSAQPAWDGNMEVGHWFGDCFWSAGGPNGGLELGLGYGPTGGFTHFMPLPAPPADSQEE